MSSKENYLSKLGVIEAIPAEEMKSPGMPVDIYLQEAENLFQWCQPDKALLVTAGLDWTLVDDLPVRTGALREAQSIWFNKRFAREQAAEQWNQKSPDAYELKEQLLHDLRYAFRKNPELLRRVADIADGTGHADMIQDLNNLSILGKNQTELLKKINFDFVKLDNSARSSKEMAELLSKANIDKEDKSKERVLRDKAYTHLKEAVDEIYACGQYVFWRDEKRVRGYASAYFRDKRSANSTTPETTEESPTE